MAPELCVFDRVPLWPARGIGHHFLFSSLAGLPLTEEVSIHKNEAGQNPANADAQRLRKMASNSKGKPVFY